MHANRDNSANYGSLRQVQRLMSDRDVWKGGGSVSFCHPRGTKSGEATSAVRSHQTLMQKKSRSEAERAFELPYFSPPPAVIKLTVQGGNTDK